MKKTRGAAVLLASLAWLLPLTVAHAQAIETIAVYNCFATNGITGTSTNSGSCSVPSANTPDCSGSGTLTMNFSNTSGNITMTGNSACSATKSENQGFNGETKGTMAIYARVAPGAVVSLTLDGSSSINYTNQAAGVQTLAFNNFSGNCLPQGLSLNSNITNPSPNSGITMSGNTTTGSDTLSFGPGSPYHGTCTQNAGAQYAPGSDYYFVNSITVDGACSASAQYAPGLSPQSANSTTSLGLKISVQGNVMNIVSGSGQTGVVSHAVSQPLTIKVVDGQTGKPVGGVGISYKITTPTGLTDASAPPSTTDPTTGIASTVLTLGSAPGTYLVQATCGNCMANITETFTETAIAPITAPNTVCPVSQGMPRCVSLGATGDGYYGARRKKARHRGIDILPNGSMDVLAAKSGTVVYAGMTTACTAHSNKFMGASSCQGSQIPLLSNVAGWGLVVIIETQSQVDGTFEYVLYAHLAQGSLAVTVGQSVTMGQKIAQMDNTGNAYNLVTPQGTLETHLHVEMRRLCKRLNIVGTPLPFFRTISNPTPPPDSFTFQDSPDMQSNGNAQRFAAICGPRAFSNPNPDSELNCNLYPTGCP